MDLRGVSLDAGQDFRRYTVLVKRFCGFPKVFRPECRLRRYVGALLRRERSRPAGWSVPPKFNRKQKRCPPSLADTLSKRTELRDRLRAAAAEGRDADGGQAEQAEGRGLRDGSSECGLSNLHAIR